MTLKEWFALFLKENGTRLFYVALVFIITIPMYHAIDAIREQLVGAWMVVLGVLIGKIRMSFGEQQESLKKLQEGKDETQD